jgi:hypothetical protein
MTLFNIGTMGGTFVVQLVERRADRPVSRASGVYPLDAYRLVFAVQAVAIMVASAAYLTCALKKETTHAKTPCEGTTARRR